MAYSTDADLQKKVTDADLIDWTDDTNNPPTTKVAATVTDAIANADSQIDAYLAVQYDLPLTVAQAAGFVNKLSVDISIHELASRRPTYDPDGRIAVAYEKAISFLKDISAGRAKLGVDDDPATVEAVQVSIATIGDRVFSEKTFEGW